jgi:hypothetical protein
MEFHGKFHGIQWNNSMEFHGTEVDGIPWNLMEFNGIGNSMEFREFTEFDGIRFRQGRVPVDRCTRNTPSKQD